MWGSKKPEPPAKPAVSAQQEPPKPSVPPPAISETRVHSEEVLPMNPNESFRPPAAQAGATARLGQSLHVKGEITGNEDLHVDGSVGGLISLEDRKLTVGPSEMSPSTLPSTWRSSLPVISPFTCRLWPSRAGVPLCGAGGRNVSFGFIGNTSSG